LIKNKFYNIGTLGKPHSLKGYLYINHELFFRNLNFINKKVYINEQENEIEEIKTHLKNRYLIKFKDIDTIKSAEKLRNQKISLTRNDLNIFLNKGLPWPGFYINENINDDIKILGYFYSDKYIFCNLLTDSEIVVPYNDHYFSFNDGKLKLINKLVN
tara:strand:+ start:296 stop:769 length:474 start_codon:yes stop_codon:yes gene_type:complete